MGDHNGKRTGEHDPTSGVLESPGNDLAREIRGTWISEVRETRWGPMRFEFRAGDESRFDVTGIPVDPSGGEAYRRSGPYRLEGNRLVTPALNEGRPTQVRLQGRQLLLKIDAGLEFLLRRG